MFDYLPSFSLYFSIFFSWLLLKFITLSRIKVPVVSPNSGRCISNGARLNLDSLRPDHGSCLKSKWALGVQELQTREGHFHMNRLAMLVRKFELKS